MQLKRVFLLRNQGNAVHWGENLNLGKPDWLKVKIPTGENVNKIQGSLKSLGLCTVCAEAKCPNRAECWGKGTATFMILGDVCTRHCGFCSVKSAKEGRIVDKNEPKKIADAVRRLNLKYVVLTSVDRDDLSDYGSGHFAECIKEIKKECPGVRVEALIPDFNGNIDCLKIVVDAKPDVIGHNIEVVRELTTIARDARAGYEKSLKVLMNVKKLDNKIYTKSSIMLGLGETEKQVLNAMDDLRMAGVDFLTIGQYLQPTKNNLEVKEFIEPDKFDYYKRIAEEKGFRYVTSGPLVRSSFKAAEMFTLNILKT